MSESVVRAAGLATAGVDRPAHRAGSGRRRPSCWTAAHPSSAAIRCSGGTRSCWPASPPGSSPVSAPRRRTGVAEIRTGLPRSVPHQVVTEAVEAWLEQAAHLLRVRRAVGLVEDALRGQGVRGATVSRSPGFVVRRGTPARKLPFMPPAPEAGGSQHEPYGLLRSVADPTDLRRLPPDQLPQLAAEIRAFLIDQVSQTGGHLGPNLGVVELTIALHRVFDSPRRPDHLRHRPPELRAQDADRSPGRLPDPAAEGRSVGLPESRGVRARLGGELARLDLAVVRGRHGPRHCSCRASPARVVALVGDGALTGGMAWEALNNIAADDDLPLVIVVNDNGRSYTPTVGGLARHLSGPAHQPAVRAGARAGSSAGQPGAAVRARRLRPAARHQDRAQGRDRAAGHVLRPGAEVRRTGRRARRGGRRAGAAARQAVRRTRAGALPDPQGQRLLRGGEPRGGPLPRGRQDRRQDRRGDRRSRRGRSGPTCSPRRSSSSARSTSGWWPSARR